MIKALYFLFVLSGAAGLIYESIWTRYLGLFVGHGAYAQIIVLVIFLGGMSLGAFAVSRWSARLKQPLYGYVAVEFAVGLIGLFFHDIFRAVTGLAYQSVYPALGGSPLLGLAKWSIAGALILPQSVLLGMTFPLMSAGVLRLRRRKPGRTLSMLYFTNSLGAAVGVLVAGFYLVQLAGLPGTLLSAAMLNLLVAAATMGVIVAARNSGIEAEPPLEQAGRSESAGGWAGLTPLQRLLLFTAFGTAVASFLYEIAWIRMLALVLGSATHSFELMLSAFILGLALGAWWIHSRADRQIDPFRRLGLVQCSMGLLALATLPLYVASFGWISSLLSTFARNDSGYVGFTLAKYGLCLIIMLPATFCAGMTLPLITRALLTKGSGERAIGSVYAWNTLGSIVGATTGGLILLPLIGLKPMLMTAAVIDFGIGILLLSRTSIGGLAPRRVVLVGAAAGVVFCGIVGGGIRLDRTLLSSGVYRTGEIAGPQSRDLLFYRDGRTATVTATFTKPEGWLSLATNGKPDASLTRAWFGACKDSKPIPLLADAGTQTLLPLIPLAYAPKARTAAIIGQGSGMSSHLLLGSPALRELVTIEIEPQMIAGSRVFYPFNRRSFDDPRSRIVIDDAKSYFASTQRQYDIIMSEPSNPWVSGVSGLFTTEFYQRIRGYLSPDGVFGQWLHVYELDDALVLSVLAALHQNFASYEVYQISVGDLLIVASNRPALPQPDWSVFQLDSIQRDLCHFAPLTPEVLNGLHLAGRSELGLLLDSYGANSDYYPVLDLGAERRRFRRDFAGGLPSLSSDWFNLLASLKGTRTPPGGDPMPALPENPRVRARSLGALLRETGLVAAADTALGPLSRDAVYRWKLWQATLASNQPPASWELWLDQANAVDRLRNDGTAGVADEEFYGSVSRYMDRFKAPQVVRDVVSFRRAVASWRFAEAAETGERLLPVVTSQRRWIGADEFRDGLVLAKLQLGDAAGAQRRFYQLAPLSTRGPADLRSQLLEAYVTAAAQRQGNVRNVANGGM
jgi:spermidine synthase